MENIFERTEMMFTPEGMNQLKSKRVAVFGVGGVGSYVCEALARSGIGALELFDSDTVCASNINRQLIALHSTLGLYKADVMKQRINDINPDCEVVVHKVFFLPENSAEFDFSNYDYIVDAVDTVAAKIELAVRAQNENIPIISSMGTGNKIHPELFEITDIYKTSVCPLAKAMRTHLRKAGVKKLKVLYSKEEPFKTGGRTPASNAFTPSCAGLMIAAQVVRDILKLK